MNKKLVNKIMLIVDKYSVMNAPRWVSEEELSKIEVPKPKLTEREALDMLNKIGIYSDVGSNVKKWQDAGYVEKSNPVKDADKMVEAILRVVHDDDIEDGLIEAQKMYHKAIEEMKNGKTE